MISDIASKNIDNKTVVLQQSSGKPGIIITFDAAQTFATGDSLEVVVSKQTLAQANGEIILQNVPAANAKKVGTATVNPKVTNAADVVKNAATYDGTLVTLPAGTFTGASNFSGTLSYIDSTATIKSQVLTGAAFENTAYPTSVQTLTGIVRVNGTNTYVNLRKAADAAAIVVAYTAIEDFTGAAAGTYWHANFVRYWNTTTNRVAFMTPTSFQTTFYTKYNNGAANYYSPSYNLFDKIKTSSANDPDVDLMTPSKNYLVAVQGGNAGNSLSTVGAQPSAFSMILNQDGINPPTSITIIFAGSKTAATDYAELTNTTNFKNLVFNPVSDQTVSYQAALRGINGRLIKSSAVFHDIGVWHSVTLTLKPTDIIANESTWSINIENLQVRGTVTNWFLNTTTQQTTEVADEFCTPILIDRVILNYGNKPAWAN